MKGIEPVSDNTQPGLVTGFSQNSNLYRLSIRLDFDRHRGDAAHFRERIITWFLGTASLMLLVPSAYSSIAVIRPHRK
jgi:hypothetical protein